jgi:hypothetical protein
LTFKGEDWFAWASAAACEPAAPAAPAPALALAAFDCWTGPSSPGLLTRAETLTFEGDSCDAFALASACAGPALFDAPAAAPACAPLFCATPPLSPGWSTRAVTLVLPGCV